MIQKTKAQATLFIILGIVLLIVVAIYLSIMFNKDSFRFFIKETRDPVQYYVEECTKSLVVDAVSNLSLQGGFIYNFNPTLNTTKYRFAYSIYEGRKTSPTLEFMGSEISKYIERNIDTCINDSRYVFTRTEPPSAKTTIFPESLLVELRYPLTVATEGKSVTYDQFTKRHMIPLGRIVQLRDEVVDDLLQYPNLMLLDKLYNTDLEMTINPYSGKIKVIDAINRSTRLRNNPLKFSFAVYDMFSLPAMLEFSSSPRDVTLRVGEPLFNQVTCNHRCTFTDNTILFDIDKSTGVINYIPDRLDVGAYNVTISITDEVYTREQKFKLTVLP